VREEERNWFGREKGRFWRQLGELPLCFWKSES